MKLNLPIVISLSTLLLSACDPRFESTAEICSSNLNQKVFASRLNHTVKASDDEYQPYLQDILSALQITDDTSEQNQAALTSIENIIKKYMPYEVTDGEIETTSALDIIESIIATTDSPTELVSDDGNGGVERNDSKLIDAFKTAKRQVADGISADDGFCIYTNDNITFENFVTQTSTETINGEEVEIKNDVLVSILKVDFSLTYDPFNRTFAQNILGTETSKDPDDPNLEIVTNFVGFYDALPNNFKAVGYTPPTVRFGSVNNTELTQKLTIDDDFDEKLGQVEYEVFDNYCTLKTIAGEDYHSEETTALILDGADTLVAEGSVLKLTRNELNSHTLYIDNQIIPLEDAEVIIDTVIVYSGEPVSNTPEDSTGPVEINNNILTIDLASTNGSVTFQNNALYIDGVLQLDDQGGALLVSSDTAIMKLDSTIPDNNTLIIDDAFTFIQANTRKVAINCASSDDTNIAIRTVQKPACTGGSFDTARTPNKLPNETGKIQTQPFNLNADNEALKRFRIEANYPNNTVVIYVSEYRNAIYDADGITEINDPTSCEKQAVLDDLYLAVPEEEREADDFEGVRLTSVPDPDYDFVYVLDENGDPEVDENGEGIIDESQLPTPTFTFTGTVVPTRQ